MRVRAMSDEMGQGGPLARIKKGKLPIPTPQEIVKDKLKELALEHGWDAVKWAWREVSAPLKQKQKPSAIGGGGALVALALVVMATKKGKRRGRR